MFLETQTRTNEAKITALLQTLKQVCSISFAEEEKKINVLFMCGLPVIDLMNEDWYVLMGWVGVESAEWWNPPAVGVGRRVPRALPLGEPGVASLQERAAQPRRIVSGQQSARQTVDGAGSQHGNVAEGNGR